ncbi:hypothetical protein D9M68_744600 [compost metagenome]
MQNQSASSQIRSLSMGYVAFRPWCRDTPGYAAKPTGQAQRSYKRVACTVVPSRVAPVGANLFAKLCSVESFRGLVGHGLGARRSCGAGHCRLRLRRAVIPRRAGAWGSGRGNGALRWSVRSDWRNRTLRRCESAAERSRVAVGRRGRGGLSAGIGAASGRRCP